MIWLACENACEEGENQYVWKENGDTAHELISRRVDPQSGLEILCVSCENCGHKYEISKEIWDCAVSEMQRLSYRKKPSLTKYPYVEPHTGELVKSKEHREEVMAAHGYHKAENGVNDEYDDELSYQLKSKRQAMEKRRADIRKKRETMIRDGLIKWPKKVPARR